MEWIDSHLHIDAEQFDDDRDEIIERMIAAGVTRAMVPDIAASGREKLWDICSAHPGVLFPMVGVHPTDINNHWKIELKAIEEILCDRQVWAIGECGIDLYWDKTYYKEQIAAFEWQLAMAREARLPIAIHARESMEPIMEALRKYSGVTGVLHCYSGDLEQAKEVIDRGYYLGIGGVVSYKKSHLPEIIKEIGIDHLLLETDAPYLAPTPYRGKRNEPSYIPRIGEVVSEILEMDSKWVAEKTTRNCETLFEIDKFVK